MIKCASLIIDDSHNEASDCFDIYSHFMLEMEEIMLSLSSGKTQDEKVLSLAYLKEIRERRKGNAFGFLLGLSNLDKVFKGLRDALVCIAARPGMGKTVMLMQIVKNASERGEIVPVFSLEMSNTKLFERLVCNVGSIDNYDLKRVAELPDDEYQHLLDTINIISQKYPLSCNDEGGISINSLRAEAIRLKKMHGKKMTALCIDYLQLITSINDALIREQVVASIMKILVKLKKELNIPIIILAQLSRGVETRGGSKIPQLSDLRESGSVEQDCDVVMFLHRDEYYGVMEDQFGESTKGVIKAIIAKNRDGQQETVKMNYIAKYSRIMDLDDFPLLPSSINLVKKDIPF